MHTSDLIGQLATNGVLAALMETWAWFILILLALTTIAAFVIFLLYRVPEEEPKIEGLGMRIIMRDICMLATGPYLLFGGELILAVRHTNDLVLYSALYLLAIAMMLWLVIKPRALHENGPLMKRSLLQRDTKNALEDSIDVAVGTMLSLALGTGYLYYFSLSRIHGLLREFATGDSLGDLFWSGQVGELVFLMAPAIILAVLLLCRTAWRIRRKQARRLAANEKEAAPQITSLDDGG